MMTTKTFRAALLGMAVFAAPAAFAAPATTQPIAQTAVQPATADAFVEGLLERTRGVLQAQQQDPAAARAQMEQIIRDSVDLDRIAAFVLGRNARTLSPEQRAEFQRAYAQFARRNTLGQLRNFAGGDIEVIRVAERKPGDAIVYSRAQTRNGDTVEVNWRILNTADGWRLVDLEVGGLWLAIQQRQEVAALLDNPSLGFDAVLAKYRPANRPT